MAVGGASAFASGSSSACEGGGGGGGGLGGGVGGGGGGCGAYRLGGELLVVRLQALRLVGEGASLLRQLIDLTSLNAGEGEEEALRSS